MITYVRNFEEARAYPVMYGTSDIFLDENIDKFYFKAVDSTGRVSMSTYEFHQVENEKPLTSADFVPKEQFDALTTKIDTLLAMLAAPPQPTPEPAPQPQQATSTYSRRNNKEVTTDGKQS